jgi:hypothetical protein
MSIHFEFGVLLSNQHPFMIVFDILKTADSYSVQVIKWIWKWKESEELKTCGLGFLVF